MKTSYTVTLAMLAGCAFAAAVKASTLKPNRPSTMLWKSIRPIRMLTPRSLHRRLRPIIEAAGGRFVAVGGAGATRAKAIAQIEGEPPQRVVVMIWDNMQQIQQWWGNPEYAALRKVVDKYAKFRSFAVEGQ